MAIEIQLILELHFIWFSTNFRLFDYIWKFFSWGWLFLLRENLKLNFFKRLMEIMSCLHALTFPWNYPIRFLMDLQRNSREFRRGHSERKCKLWGKQLGFWTIDLQNIFVGFVILCGRKVKQKIFISFRTRKYEDLEFYSLRDSFINLREKQYNLQKYLLFSGLAIAKTFRRKFEIKVRYFFR